MNSRIAINMIQSYSCSTQTPNNIYFRPTLISKLEGVCDGDLTKLGITSNTHHHLALNYSIFILQLLFRVTNLSNWTGIKYPGVPMNTSKVHINNMYIKYTFVHFAILLIRQVFGVVPLPVTIPFVVEALVYRLRSNFGLLYGSVNLLAILLEVPFLSLCPFSWI